MAGRFGRGVKASIATGTSVKTLMQLVAAANHAIKITEISISFDGTNNTHEPILVEILRQTDAGTMTSLTLVKADDSIADSLDTTGQHTATAEPTAGDILWAAKIHPQTGVVYPLGDGNPIAVGAGDRLGVRATAANDVDAAVVMAFEE